MFSPTYFVYMRQVYKLVDETNRSVTENVILSNVDPERISMKEYYDIVRYVIVHFPHHWRYVDINHILPHKIQELFDSLVDCKNPTDGNFSELLRNHGGEKVDKKWYDDFVDFTT